MYGKIDLYLSNIFDSISLFSSAFISFKIKISILCSFIYSSNYSLLSIALNPFTLKLPIFMLFLSNYPSPKNLSNYLYWSFKIFYYFIYVFSFLSITDLLFFK